MPKIAHEVPEVIESITRPVVQQAMRQLMDWMPIPQDTQIQFNGNSVTIPQAGSTLQDKHGPRNRFAFDGKFKITVTETYPEEYALSLALQRPENPVVFKDTGLDVYIKPSYETVKISIDVEYRTPDRSSAELWENRIKRKVGTGKDDYMIELSYHYGIPIPFIVLLCQFHTMREAVAPLNETIGDWLQRCFSPKFTVVTNQAGREPLFVIRESQIQVPCWYDFSKTPPIFDREDPGGSWVCRFNASFNYDKPEEMVMMYPMMIHNQIIPRRFRDDAQPYEIINTLMNPSLSQDLFRKLGTGNQWPGVWAAYPGLMIPYFDDWMPEVTYSSTQSLLRILLQVDPLNKKDIVNLASLVNWEFKASALEYMRDAPESMFQRFESVISVTLHNRYSMMDSEKLVVDLDGGGINIHYVDDLELREWYHLHVSLMYDFTLLSDAAKTRLCQHGEFCIELMKVLDPTMEGKGLLPELLGNGTINRNAFNTAADYFTAKRLFEADDAFYKWRSIGALIVQVNKGS